MSAHRARCKRTSQTRLLGSAPLRLVESAATITRCNQREKPSFKRLEPPHGKLTLDRVACSA